jgi:hypothetical protein
VLPARRDHGLLAARCRARPVALAAALAAMALPCAARAAPDRLEGGTAAATEAAPVRNWLSLSAQQDLMFIGSATRACSADSDYACFGADDSYYDRIPYEGEGGEISGGLDAATTRFMIGYERALVAGLSAGVRVGFAIGGAPKAPGGNDFLPLHAEGRLAWWFGGFAPRTGPRFFVAASGGLAQVDAELPVYVYESEAAYLGNRYTPYRAYRKTGTGFLALGAGALVAVTPSSGILGEVRLMRMLDVGGTVLAPSLGYAVGF